jgi:urease accessory protein
MRATGRPPIIIRSLPTQRPPQPGAETIIRVPMTADDRRKVRRRLEAPDGTAIGLELPTGTVLRPGQVLHATGQRVYVVDAAPEDVLVLLPRDPREAARIGHLIGNLHRDIDLDGEGIAVLWDPVLEGRLRRAGLIMERVRRPFHGNPPGAHGH